MEIITRKLSEIKPYEKNPRKNDAAVEFVMNSIKEFKEITLQFDKSLRKYKI